MLLWKSICSNPLLGKTNLILFLNKIDIFRAKLRAGIHFGQYIISYGNRPNDYENTSACESRAAWLPRPSAPGPATPARLVGDGGPCGGGARGERSVG